MKTYTLQIRDASHFILKAGRVNFKLTFPIQSQCLFLCYSYEKKKKIKFPSTSDPPLPHPKSNGPSCPGLLFNQNS